MRLRGDRLRGPPRLPAHRLRGRRRPDRQLGGARGAQGPGRAAGRRRHPARLPRPVPRGGRPVRARLAGPRRRRQGSRRTTAGTATAAIPNYAGARGPMQFLEPTFVHAAKLAGLTDPDICDPADAIPAAAAYLKSNGAPNDWQRALFRYNPADWYPPLVMGWAERYGYGAASSGRSTGPDQPALRADLVRPRAAALLRGHVLRALPRRARSSPRRSARRSRRSPPAG